MPATRYHKKNSSWYCIILNYTIPLYGKLRRNAAGGAKKSSAMNIDNTQSQMRKGVLEFCILSIIRHGEAYPSDIIERMKAANLHILEGTLYPLLTRLKNADLLSYRWVESNSGPPRKYFMLTDKGLEFYRDLESTWNELAGAVSTLTKPDVKEKEPQ